MAFCQKSSDLNAKHGVRSGLTIKLEFFVGFEKFQKLWILRTKVLTQKFFFARTYQSGICSKIIGFSVEMPRWKGISPDIQNLLTDMKNIKNCGFYEQNTEAVFISFFEKISKSVVDKTIGRTKIFTKYDL